MRPLTCPNGHCMDDGLFECPACGAYRPSASDPNAIIEDGQVVGSKIPFGLSETAWNFFTDDLKDYHPKWKAYRNDI